MPIPFRGRYVRHHRATMVAEPQHRTVEEHYRWLTIRIYQVWLYVKIIKSNVADKMMVIYTMMPGV